MIQQVRKLLEARPFVPFTIRTSDGVEYRIPTSEHADIPPKGGFVTIYDDEGLGIFVSGLHITSVASATTPA
jgi:hypothetical protein